MDGIVQSKVEVAQAMCDIASKFGLLHVLRTALRSGRQCLKPLAFFLLFGLVVGTSTARVGAQNRPSTLLAPGVPFAIDDFDGDFLPDLISIQTGATGSSGTNYWIQLQLSAAGKQSIRLVAPMGGLSIEARDVNGDHIIDLVLATAWSRKPVAIFLNDGRGNFSRVELTDFPEAFSESTAGWASSAALATDAAGLPAQPPNGACRETRSAQHTGLESNSLSRASAGFFFVSFLTSTEGRAPPVEVSDL